MKISSRISLVFSLISSAVIILFGLIIYQLEKNHAVTDFSNALKNRVNTTEQFFLEQESFTKSEFETIKSQFTQKLNDETEEVIDISYSTEPIFKNNYSTQLKSDLVSNNALSFFQDKRQGESKIFTVKGKKYVIIVTAYDKIGRQNLSFLLKIIVLLTLIAIPIIFIFGFAYSKKALLPIRKKIEKANRISASNLSERLKIINPNDELGQLAVAFNNLLDRLEKSFETQKSFISNASHEIKNPLTAIMGEAEIAVSKTRSTEEYIESLNIVLSESERLDMTVNNLLQLSKVTANEEKIKFESTNLDSFLKLIIQNYDFINVNHKIEYISHLTSNNKSVLINSNLLKTAFINIIDNACKFSGNQAVKIALESVDKNFLITVTDTGIGIPKDEIKRITEPFFRGSNTISISGSGIGLALSSKIIQLHNGKIEITSKQNKGTVISILIPYQA